MTHQKPQQPSGPTQYQRGTPGDTVDEKDSSLLYQNTRGAGRRGCIGCDHYSRRAQITLVLYLFNHSELCSSSEGYKDLGLWAAALTIDRNQLLSSRRKKVPFKASLVSPKNLPGFLLFRAVLDVMEYFVVLCMRGVAELLNNTPRWPS